MLDLDAKEFLGQYQAAEHRIRAMEDQLQRLDRDDGYHSPGYTGMPGPIGPVPSPVADLADRRIDLRIRIMAAREEQIRIQTDVIRCVLKLKGAECEVLILRYIDGHAWEEIGEMMHYSRRRAFEIHEAALEHLQSVLDGSE